MNNESIYYLNARHPYIRSKAMATEQASKAVLERGDSNNSEPLRQQLAWRYLWKRRFRGQYCGHKLRSSVLTCQNDKKKAHI